MVTWRRALTGVSQEATFRIALLFMAPQDYRDLAEACERAAARANDPAAKRIYENLAKQYHNLAEDIERYGQFLGTVERRYAKKMAKTAIKARLKAAYNADRDRPIPLRIIALFEK